MFEKYNPLKGEQLQLLKPDGSFICNDSSLPILSDEQAIKAYEHIVLARAVDEWAVSLNRQGRLPTYALNKGQEANSVGALMALRQTDWFVQAFRELGGLIVRGVPLKQYYLAWLGNELGFSHDKEKYHTLPVAIPIASQYQHAAGLGYAEKYKKSDKVVIAFVGDGGTSEGDFYEAINFAGVWKSPNIFYVQNNQWAISVPRSIQTATKTIAEKAAAAGIEGVQIDGNDIFAVYAAVTMAAEKARKGEGATLIEGFTYRLGAHTTADDPTRYRDENEVAKIWGPKDPIIRLELYLKSKKLMDDAKIALLKDEAKKVAMEAFKEAENFPPPSIEDIFKYQYKEMPRLLKRQLEELKAAKGER